MEERLRRLETRVSELQRQVQELSRALAASRPDAAAAGDISDAPAAVADARPEGTSVAPLIGRTVLVLGGGELLRALTERGALAPGTGVVLGLVYALAWLSPLLRRGAARSPVSATLHGVAALLLSHLLIWEATARLGLMGPRAAVLVLGAACAAGLSLAAARRLRGMAWCFTLGTLTTVAALLVSQGSKGTTTALLLALGGATTWLAYLRRWHGLRWPVAATANLTILMLVERATLKDGPPPGFPSPHAVQALGVALVAVYLGSFVVRTLARRRDVSVFEVLQTLGAMMCGFGGAVIVARSGAGDAHGLGASAALAALVCYAVSFAFVRRTQGRGSNFFFYAYLALTLAFLGSSLLVGGHALAFVWLVLAVAAAALGGRYDRLTLCIHAAVYSLAAALMTGVFTGIVRLPSGDAGSALLDGAPLTATFLLVVCYLVMSTTQRCRMVPDVRRVPRFLVAIAAAVAVAGAAQAAVARLAAGGDPASDLAATVRTGVLAAAAMGLAVASRRPALKELGWLVRPVLVLAGAKLLIEDLRLCGPGTLFAGLALYGVALIMAPRLSRRRPPAVLSARNLGVSDS